MPILLAEEVLFESDRPLRLALGLVVRVVSREGHRVDELVVVDDEGFAAALDHEFL